MTHSLAVHVLLATGTLLVVGAASRARAEASLKSDLQAVAQKRIFFGHQSVGLNILDGLQQLAAREGVPLRIAEARAPGIAEGTLAHAALEENGQPLKKLRSFARAVSSGEAKGADVAFMKFCYVDITADTDVSALFAAYRAMIAEVQAASPGTTLLHVTVPLQTVERGLRGSVKRMLGRPLWGASHDARREEFNDLLRREYAGKAPFFDLARVESTRPDGKEETAAWNGRQVRALVPEYTDDGGHLNERGRMRAAQELVAVLAATAGRPARTATR